MENKYTIKKLLDNAYDIENVYKKFKDYFTKDDIKYALNKRLDLSYLYEYLGKRFDKELMKLYKEKMYEEEIYNKGIIR